MVVGDYYDGIGFDGEDHDDVIQVEGLLIFQLLVQVEGQLHENERVADKLKQDLRQKRSTLLERRSSFAIRSDGVSFIGLPSMSFQIKLIGVHKQIIFAQGCVGYRPDSIHS